MTFPWRGPFLHPHPTSKNAAQASSSHGSCAGAVCICATCCGRTWQSPAQRELHVRACVRMSGSYSHSPGVATSSSRFSKWLQTFLAAYLPSVLTNLPSSLPSLPRRFRWSADPSRYSSSFVADEKAEDQEKIKGLCKLRHLTFFFWPVELSETGVSSAEMLMRGLLLEEICDGRDLFMLTIVSTSFHLALSSEWSVSDTWVRRLFFF